MGARKEWLDLTIQGRAEVRAAAAMIRITDQINRGGAKAKAALADQAQSARRSLGARAGWIGRRLGQTR